MCVPEIKKQIYKDTIKFEQSLPTPQVHYKPKVNTQHTLMGLPSLPSLTSSSFCVVQPTPCPTPQFKKHNKFNDLFDKKYRKLDAKHGAFEDGEEEVVVDIEDAKDYREYHDVSRRKGRAGQSHFKVQRVVGGLTWRSRVDAS